MSAQAIPSSAPAGPARLASSAPAAARAPRNLGVLLLDADPEFRLGLQPGQLAEARRAVVVPRLDAPKGPWTPPPASSFPGPVAGIVLLSGVLARHVRIGDRTATELLGPGEAVDPWTDHGDALPFAVRWQAVGSVRAAVLDGRFAVAARRLPWLAVVLQRKLCRRADRLAAQSAALQLPAVEQRILAILLDLAARFGRPAADGTVVSLPLTHEVLGQLVGARRPTVTLALRSLGEAGLVTRDSAGWLVADGAREALGLD